MKKNVLVIALLFALSIVNAQNIQNIGVSFTQTLYPKKTLPANIKNYAVTVTTPYLKDDSTFRKIAEDKYQADLKNYPNVIAEAKKKFNEVEMVNHNVKVEEAKEKHQFPNLSFDVLNFNSPETLQGKKFDYIIGNGILHHLYYNMSIILFFSS